MSITLSVVSRIRDDLRTNVLCLDIYLAIHPSYIHCVVDQWAAGDKTSVNYELHWGSASAVSISS